MRRADRLFRLIALLRASDLIRAQDLSEKLEVSVRTVYRDIAHLQGAGLPIQGEAGMGYVLQPGFDLPSMTLSFEEIDALALALKFIEEAGDQGLVEAAINIRSKIEQALPEVHTNRLQNAPFFAARKGFRAPDFTVLIRKAIHLKLKIQMTYITEAQSNTQRTVRPLSLTVFSAGWMVAAWCELRNGFRYFRLDRIKELVLTEDHFKDEQDKSLQQFRLMKSHN